MKRECEKIRPLAIEAAEGVLDEAARSRVLDHAAGCDDCGQALEFQRRLRRALETAPDDPPPALYFEGVLAEIHRLMPPAPSRPLRARRPWRRQRLATAAMAALFLLWVGASLPPSALHPAGPSGTGVGGRSVRAAARADQLLAGGLVVDEQYGLVDANSEILKPEVRRGLREIGLTRLVARAPAPPTHAKEEHDA